MSIGSIPERQETPEALGLARAFRRRYAVARRWRSLRVGLGLIFGTVGVLIALVEESTGEYISALAVLWLVLGRTVLQWYEQRRRDEAALAQEAFDTKVFGLPWNGTKVGAPPDGEDVRDWGRKQAEGEMHGWYPDVRPARHPVDVLICQRASVTWARQDHATYAQILRWSVGGMLVATVALGLALDLGLGEYLLRLGLPVLPAALDVLDTAKAHATLATTKLRLAQRANALYADAEVNGRAPSVDECRQVQDEMFDTRRLAGVPNWFYRLRRAQRQQNMEDVARAQVKALPASLR